jgi:uncharacterized phage protein (TIGR02218 family)
VSYTLTAPQQAHIADNATSLAFGIRLVRRDGTVIAWTEAHENATVTVNGQSTLLVSNPGFNVQSLTSTAGLSVDNTEITLIDGDDISRADILASKWDGASVHIFRYNTKSPSDGTYPPKKSGSFGNFKPRLGHFVVEFRDLRQPLQHNATWVLQEACRWRLGDSRCTKTLTDDVFTFTGVAVTGAGTDRQFSADALTQADDFFGEGELTWTDGLNSGCSFKVRTFADGVVTLSEPAIFEILVGDEFTIVAGCRKRVYEDCRDKFDNIINFGGEPNKPFRDGLVSDGTPTEVPNTAPTPAPAPAPAAPAPPPSAPTSRTTVWMLDYRQTYDAGNITTHARGDRGIRSFSTNQAATSGATWTAGVLAANPSWQGANYFILNEVSDSLPTNHDYYPVMQRANAQDAWVLNEPAGTKVQWTTAYGKYEINITSALPSLSSKTYSEWKAEDWDYPTRLDELTDIEFAFLDNCWERARVTADYDRNGTNETPTASAADFRAGLVAYIGHLKAGRPGLKVIGNVAGHDLTAFGGTDVDIAFSEGDVGKSYGVYETGGWTSFRNRHLALQENTADNESIAVCFGESTNYARHRLAFVLASMVGAGICCIDDTPSLAPVYLDEMDVETGSRVGAVPDADEDELAVLFEGALMLANTSSASATFDTTAYGGGLWKRIDAADYDNQDPTVNSGANVTSVTLAADTALLLIPQ